MKNPVFPFLMFLFFFGIHFCAFSQELSGTWPAGKGQPVYLLREWNVTPELADSAFVKPDGSFRFETSRLKHGVYAFYIPGFRLGEFIWCGETVKIPIVQNTGKASSPENDRWQQLRVEVDAAEKKIGEAQDLLMSTNVMSEAGQRKADSLTTVLRNLASQRNQLFRSFITKFPDAYAAKHIAPLLIYPVITEYPQEMAGMKDENEFFKRHWFDAVEFKSEEVFHNPYLYERIQTYFTAFAGGNMEEMQRAVKQLQEKTGGNEILKNELARLLLNYLREKGPDEMFVWMADTGSEGCEAGLVDASMKERAELLRKLQPGNPAPDFSLPDKGNRMLSLSSLKGKNVLLVFWASSCEHCMNELPSFSAIAQPYLAKGFDVVAVSLDEAAANWNMGIMMMGLMNWTHLCDLKGWESPAVKTYGIRRTPASFLISKEGMILARDLKAETLRAKLKELYPSQN